MNKWWRIELFNGPIARSDKTVITRFYSQKVGNVLAYLSLNSRIAHSREVIAETFWPDAEPGAARLNLRVGLAALRRQLEPPGVPAGSVLIAARDTVWLNPERVATDVDEFHSALEAADNAASPTERKSRLDLADRIAVGELLPGCYDDWASSERRRISDLRFDLLGSLMRACEEAGDIRRALDCAHRMLAHDNLNEDSHCHLMRLYLASAQVEAARRQYQELERTLQIEFGVKPSEAARQLYDSARTYRPASASASASTSNFLPASSQPAVQTRVRRSSIARTTTPRPVSSPKLPSVPAVFTKFFGREHELEQLPRLLSDSFASSAPVITITGPGGRGKTRLALEIAQKLSDDFNQQVLYVPLAEITSPDKIIESVANTLPSPRSGNLKPLDLVEHALAYSRTVLVLDNFEQLLSPRVAATASVAILTELIYRCPRLSILITSRQALGLEGELEIQLDPLPTPLHPGLPERLMEFAGVQLFVDRAQAARADFQITPRNCTAIAELCNRLEGLPLAIELAAPWARILTPTQMLERLSDRFEMLVSRRRDIPDRHRTLRAALEWSFRLLAPDVQQTFLMLSVFRGGWSADAAASICDDSKVVDKLLILAECSMITSQMDELERQRYFMLESLREFARELMPEDKRMSTASTHLNYFFDLANRARHRFHREDAPEWMETLDLEHENLQAALDQALSTHDYNTFTQMAIGLDWFYFTRGYLTARLMHVRQVKDNLDSLGELKPQALLWTAHFESPEFAFPILIECMQMFTEIGDNAGVSDTHYTLGSIATVSRNYEEAASQFTKCLELRRELNQREGLHASRAALAHVNRLLGRSSKAQALLEEQLADLRSEGDIDGAAKVKIALGNMAIEQGKYSLAEVLLQESLSTYRAIGQRWGVADCLRNLGNARTFVGGYDAGAALLIESLKLFREIEDQSMVEQLCLDLAEHAFADMRLDETELYVNQCHKEIDQVKPSENLARFRMLQAAISLSDGDHERAGTLLVAAREIEGNVPRGLSTLWLEYYEASLLIAKGGYSSARNQLIASIERSIEMGLIPCLLTLCSRAALVLRQGGNPVDAISIISKVYLAAETASITPNKREKLFLNTLLSDLTSSSEPPQSSKLLAPIKLAGEVQIALSNLSL